MGDDLYALSAKPGRAAGQVSAERVGKLFQHLIAAQGGWVLEGEVTKGLLSDNLAGGDFPEWNADGGMAKPGTREIDALVDALLAKGIKIERTHKRLDSDGT